MWNPDFRDLLCAFDAAEVDALVVGSHAMAAYGHLRATKDLDVWVRPSPENARRVFRALAEFGAPLAGVSREDFERPGTVLQIGVAPVRIDLLTTIDGVEFEEAWRDRTETILGDVSARVISLAHLIRNKRSTGRAQDRIDADALESLGV